MKRLRSLLSAVLLLTPVWAAASPSLAGGVWFNYRDVSEGGAAARDDETYGDMADEAFILYVDDTDEMTGWSLSAELRIGPGSFTDPSTNTSGDSFALHKAWIGAPLWEGAQLRIGKSQVPFGWKTVNFWPGDILQGAYGDQMDVGLKLVGGEGALRYQAAYYHADDWGETSTDTVDDNGHWGSSETYRKVQTAVADLSYEVAPDHRLALSVQSGRLQDLNTTADPLNPVDGSHQAGVIHYHGVMGGSYMKAEIMQTERTLPANHVSAMAAPEETSTRRAAIELGHTLGAWFFYLDASWAKSLTEGNDAGTVYAHAPGVRYSFGPGHIYMEYLTQNGYIDRDGDAHEGDFDALYLSLDYYF